MLNLLSRIISPHEIVLKKGSLIRLKYLEGKKAVIVLGQSSFEATDNFQKVKTFLSSSKLDVDIIKLPSGDPTFDSVNGLLVHFHNYNPDIIIGIGGGSVLDSVKIARLLFENDENIIQNNSQNFSFKNSIRKTQLILIPTTCGSGSEVSSVVVIKENKTPKKITYVSHSFIPDIVILDPSVLISLPVNLIASTAIDALTHALESYSSKISIPFSESYAKIAASEIKNNLESTITNKDQILYKEKLQIAALNAGIAQNISSVGASHAIAHALGALLNIPHGIANGIVLSKIIQHNDSASPKVMEILNFIGFNSVPEFGSWLANIQSKANIPNKWGIYLNNQNQNIVNDLAILASEDVCIKTNPKRLSMEEIQNILLETK